MDFCCRVPAERIQAFQDKWGQVAQRDDLTWQERLELERENPLEIAFDPALTVNGKTLTSNRGCGICWNPCMTEGTDEQMPAAMEHYGLDPKDGWSIWRYAFAWATKRRPALQQLGITLRRRPVELLGPRFCVTAPGDCFPFFYRQVEHTLTVQKYQRKELEKAGLFPGLTLPTHHVVMQYAINPELPGDVISVRDCADCDQPRWSLETAVEPGAAAVGIIGGADGPTAIVLGTGKVEAYHMACSALHFKPVDTVQWRMVFRERRVEDLTVPLDLN